MNAHELREAFLRFFEERDHRRISSAPIVPPGDPTLLFTSAGMVQFKPYFLGQARPPHPRLASVQKCFRTSDIESVGDASHLTFFEMLGNFSIGDYFKERAIPWAWEFVTRTLGLRPERLWAAVYLDDDEAYDLWRQAGVPAQRLVRYGEEHNYWFSGEVGPCGPCSEIHYDFGERFGCGPDCEPSHDCGRFVEIWNLVFMSFYCDGESRMPLPSRNIDTGSGLERVASTMLFESDEWDKARLPTVYDTDLFRPIIRRIEELSGRRYGEDERTDRAIRIVTEHARAVTFLVGDERTPVVPSNEERGYVVRRLLRRAVYFGRRDLGIERPFLPEMTDVVIETMSPSYPELERQRQFVQDIVIPEERRFDQTLERGLEMLDGLLSRQAPETRLSGADAFLLHDTYGFPIELTREIAARHNVTVDEAGFDEEMERQRERARAHAGAGEAVAADTLYASLVQGETEFMGYDMLEGRSRVLALVGSAHLSGAQGQAGGERGASAGRPATEAGVGPASLRPAEEARAGEQVELFLAATPFYPEGGGQVGDRGRIAGPDGVVTVEDTQRVAERLIVHRGRVAEGRMAVGDEVTAAVDPRHREDTMRNHTATHLLHAALRAVLGTHVRQAGSLVAPDHLRFDFTHTEAMTDEQLEQVESVVNEKVRQDIPVQTRQSSFDEAMREGVLAFFGERYGQEVRVVEVNSVVPKFSAELCGGTHCRRTGEIGSVVITGESSIGSGMRRIEALTGRGAEAFVRRQRQLLNEITREVNAPRDALVQKVQSLVQELDAQRRKVERLERSLARAPATSELLEQAVEVDGVRVLAVEVDAPSADALRYVGDAVRKSLPSGVAVLASVIEGKPQFLAIVSSDLLERGLHAGNLLKRVAAVAGGGGGGRPEMAQGGGRDVSRLPDALAVVPDAVRESLGRRNG